MYYDVLRCITCACVKQFVSSGVHDPWRIWCKLYMVCCLWHVKSLSAVFRNPSYTPPDLAFSVWFPAVSMKVPHRLKFDPSLYTRRKMLSLRHWPQGQTCFAFSNLYTLMIFDALHKQYKHSAHSHDISIHQCCFPVPSESKHQRFGEQQQAAWCCWWRKLSQPSTGFNRLRLQAFFGWMMRWFRSPPRVQFCVAVWGIEYDQIYPDINP